ncbi:spore coat protein [Mobilitalea sibirica]|uniref:Spore coat protein n=1 Tax=Mobilitalea sibirica TaxID=1462919 RepID=A0A8J7H2P1_9FIRM|nr:spore coat protein [Mobilitalea sibirica]MBH1940845.1 spore coat protein [Mobilitalea sibirica]
MITNITLSTKEQYLLQDHKTHEEQCILKYDNYANLATDEQLKAVFRSNSAVEKKHLEIINQLLNGKVPSMGGQSNQSSQQSSKTQQSMPSSQQSSVDLSNHKCFKASDKEMCIDMLNTEKYVSGVYDTSIFEFKNAQIRDVLNHIQKEEQKHGEAIYAYMESKGMYSS